MKDKSKPASPQPEQQAKHEAAQKPSRDDVHEQREAGQQREGTVRPAVRPTQQSQLELDRAAGEGMTAPLSEPDLSKSSGKPSPGANSLAGRRG